MAVKIIATPKQDQLRPCRICMSIESDEEAQALKKTSWGIHAEDDGGYYAFTIARMVWIPLA